MTAKLNEIADKEKILRAFDDILNPIYLEMEAGEAEDIHVKVAEKTMSLVALIQKQERAKTLKAIHPGQLMEATARQLADKYKVYNYEAMEGAILFQHNLQDALEPFVKRSLENSSDKVSATNGNQSDGGKEE